MRSLGEERYLPPERVVNGEAHDAGLVEVVAVSAIGLGCGGPG